MKGTKIYQLSQSLTWVIFFFPESLPSTKEIKSLSSYFKSENKRQNRQLCLKTHLTVIIPVNERVCHKLIFIWFLSY